MHTLKYLKSKTLDWKDKGIRKPEFEAKNQILLRILSYVAAAKYARYPFHSIIKFEQKICSFEMILIIWYY